MSTRKRSHELTAADVGTYAFCAKAWELQRSGVEADATGKLALQQGTEFHHAHSRRVQTARLLLRLGTVLFLLAFLLYLFNSRF